ncbi:MAG: T9SS C-terminal target domain-containing protein [Ignavibacteriae bacterium]|nr:MAG: T9SS C-terminal target domain-containing protein [Ignavibacteriota bacterium]
MRYKIFNILILLIITSGVLVADGNIKKYYAAENMIFGEEAYPIAKVWNTAPVPVPFFNLDPGFISDTMVIGPEIMTTIFGSYDYKTNGEANHYLQVDPTNPLLYHSVDMQMDTTDLDPATAPTRRTYYAYSSDGGLTWTNAGTVPVNLRSGYPSLRLRSGTAVIANHNTSGGFLTSNLYIDLVPQLGSFTEYLNPVPLPIWPQIEVLSNNNVGILSRPQHVTGTDYDTLYYQIWNGTVIGPKYIMYVTTPPYTGTVGSNTRFNLATNGNGLLTAAIAPVLEDDTLGASRIYQRTSNDNGVTWGPLVTIYSPFYEGADVIAAAGGSDLVYKPGTDKWFYAFPATKDSVGFRFYESTRLYLKKSDGSLIRIVSREEVGAAESYYQPMAFSWNIDFPSLAWSADNNVLYCAYSVTTQDSGAGGFNSRDIFYQYSTDEGSTWSAPIRITNTPLIDESYPSLSYWNKGGTGGATYDLNIVYMKDPGVGPYAFNGTGTRAAHSVNYQIFRKITEAAPIGIKDPTSIVKDYKLEQNFPNPFNPATVITYNLPVNGFVTLKVYDITGREVKTLVNENQTRGSKEITFDGSNFASGIYFYSLTVNEFTATKKMILVK